MKKQKLPPIIPPKKYDLTLRLFIAASLLLIAIPAISVFAYMVTTAREIAYEAERAAELARKPVPLASFPIGVDPSSKTITENPVVDSYFQEHIATKSKLLSSRSGWFGYTFAKLAQQAWYQNLASPTGRVLVIQSGERKEEIANHFARTLNWNAAQKSKFLAQVIDVDLNISDGKFVPWTYVVARDAEPEDVTTLLHDRFDTQIKARYGYEIEKVVPLKDALTIASLLEREAYDFTDMRDISGIIWNRLFIGMNLQIDATLQYAKAAKSASWWPRVVPSDKYIASPYNTYKNKGLPPGPISNASLDAVLAALNPRKTDCMFYFHDPEGGFHCSVTYADHVKGLKEVYGRGK